MDTFSFIDGLVHFRNSGVKGLRVNRVLGNPRSRKCQYVSAFYIELYFFSFYSSQVLVLCMLGKNFSRRHFEMFFRIFTR